MALESGTNLGLLAHGAIGEQHYNELMRQFRGLDALIQCNVLSMALTAPPGSPSNGDMYVPATGSTGDWSGKDGQVSRWTTKLTPAQWEFYIPKEGWALYDRNTDKGYTHSGSAWVADLNARTDTANAFTKSQRSVPSVLTDAATIAVDALLSNNFRVVLGGNRTLGNPSNLADGMVLNYYIKQDGGGSRTLAYDTKYKFPNGVAPVLSTGADAVDFMSCYYDATDDILVCNLNKGHA